MDCLARISAVEKSIGVAVVVLDVLDCGDIDAVKRRSAFTAPSALPRLLPSPCG
jgi:hypothetical protein